MSERLVVLTGTAEVNNFYFTDTSIYERQISNLLADAGFHVASVKVVRDSFPQVGAVDITIACNVDTQFTAEQQREAVLAILASIPTDSTIMAVGSPIGSLFFNTNLDVLSDGINPTTNQDTTTDDPLTNTLSKIGQTAADAAKEAAKAAAGNVMSPIAIAAIVIGGLFILKRK